MQFACQVYVTCRSCRVVIDRNSVNTTDKIDTSTVRTTNSPLTVTSHVNPAVVNAGLFTALNQNFAMSKTKEAFDTR
jgi:ferredoxin